MDIMGPKSHLKIGMEGVLNGEQYKIIGRIKNSTYDTEEGRRYMWDEWFLISQYGRRAWLSEDEWEFQLERAFSPKTPFNPQNAGYIVNLEGQNLRIKERGQARIEFAEGELNFKTNVGQEINFLDIDKGYGVEWNEKEIKFYKSQIMSPDEIYKAFSLDPALIPIQAYQSSGYVDRYEEIPKKINIQDDNIYYHYDGMHLKKKSASGQYKNIPSLLLISGILLIVLSFITSYLTEEHSRFYIRPAECTEGKIIGPIRFNRAGMIHLIKMGKVLPCRINIALLNDKKEKIWWAAYENRWTEGNSYFRLPSDGRYYIKITSTGSEQTLSDSKTITLKIYDRAIRGTFYYCTGIMLILIAIIMFLI